MNRLWWNFAWNFENFFKNTPLRNFIKGESFDKKRVAVSLFFILRNQNQITLVYLWRYSCEIFAQVRALKVRLHNLWYLGYPQESKKNFRLQFENFVFDLIGIGALITNIILLLKFKEIISKIWGLFRFKSS
jgi:hypothetical protein